MERAARLFGAVAALRATLSDAASHGFSLGLAPVNCDEYGEYERQVAARAALGAAAFDAAWAEGQRLPLEQVLAQARRATGPVS